MRKISFLLFVCTLACILTSCALTIKAPSYIVDNPSTFVSSTMASRTNPISSTTTNLSTIHPSISTTTTTTVEKTTTTTTATTTAPTTTTVTSTTTTSEDPGSTTNSTSNATENTTQNEGKLIVNGRELSLNNYFHMDAENLTIDIPITAIMKELGAKVEWKSETKVVISHGDVERVMDITDTFFGILVPPGSRHWCREVINGEIVVDYISVRGWILGMGADFKIDFDTMTTKIG